MLNELDREAQRVAGYLGLAQRAGKIAAGDTLVLAALKKKKARLVLVAADAAPTVQTEIGAAAEAAGCACYQWQTKAVLGLAVGKSARGALAVCDAGFAQAIRKVLENTEVK